MSGTVTNRHSWRGRQFTVEVLFSQAGVAQHIYVGSNAGGVLIDTGDGVLRDLLAQGIDLKTIAAVLYTHGHFDHMGGLHSLLGFMRMIGRTEPLPIYAPEGCTEAFATVHNFRRCYPDDVPFAIPLLELQPHEEVTVDGLTVTPYPMVHAGSVAGGGVLDRIPAMGYRIERGGETVAITGDTGMCDEVRALVRGADLAIIEATFADSEGIDAEVFEKVHLSEAMATELGGTAKEFILVHRAKRA